MPLTASKTEADTIAARRLVKNGLVPPVRAVSFMIPIHCRTGSGVAATADGPETPNRNARSNTVTTKLVTALILLMAIPPVLLLSSSAPSRRESSTAYLGDFFEHLAQHADSASTCSRTQWRGDGPPLFCFWSSRSLN